MMQVAGVQPRSVAAARVGQTNNSREVNYRCRTAGMMTSPNIVIAAPVWARNDTEADRLKMAIAALAQHGLPIVLADGGSPEDFLTSIAALPGVTILSKADDRAPRLTGQIQRTFTAARAMSPQWILYTEPDKQWFFENRLAEFIELVNRYPEADLVFPARNRESFETFPAYQRKIETAFNKIAFEWLGGSADLLYGPLLLRADLTHHLDGLTEDIGWGWRPYLMAIAKRTRLYPVRWIEDFPCPEDQRGEDEPKDRLYRLRQMAQNMMGLTLGLTTLLEENAGSD